MAPTQFTRSSLCNANVCLFTPFDIDALAMYNSFSTSFPHFDGWLCVASHLIYPFLCFHCVRIRNNSHSHAVQRFIHSFYVYFMNVYVRIHSHTQTPSDAGLFALNLNFFSQSASPSATLFVWRTVDLALFFCSITLHRILHTKERREFISASQAISCFLLEILCFSHHSIGARSIHASNKRHCTVTTCAE